MNESQDLDDTRCTLFANAGSVRAVERPFIYFLTEIYIVPVKQHKEMEGGAASVCPTHWGAPLSVTFRNRNHFDDQVLHSTSECSTKPGFQINAQE